MSDEMLLLAAARWNALVSSIGPTQWSCGTPCEGWDVTDLIVHVIERDRVIVAQLDAAGERTVQQKIAVIHIEGVSVESDLAGFAHHSTSRRMGRTCLVCRIWLWSNAATRIKTPLLSGTSY